MLHVYLHSTIHTKAGEALGAAPLYCVVSHASPTGRAHVIPNRDNRPAAHTSGALQLYAPVALTSVGCGR